MKQLSKKWFGLQNLIIALSFCLTDMTSMTHHYNYGDDYVYSDKTDIGKRVDEGFSYSSDNNSVFLSIDELKELIKDHRFNDY